MRFVTYLACATLVARADWAEDDDDLQFMRSLSASNGSNSTTPAVTTGSPNTTAGPNVTTTTGASVVGGDNVTTTLASVDGGEPTTTMPKSEGGGGEGGSMDKKCDEQCIAEGLEKLAKFEGTKALLKNISNDTDLAAVQNINVTQNVVAKKYPEKVAPAGNATTVAPGRRRLSTAATNAENLFCSAFGFASSAAACGALDDKILTEIFYGKDKADGLANCVIEMSLDAKTGSGNCKVPDDSVEGVCFQNSLAGGNQQAAPGQKLTPVTTACTKAVPITGDDENVNYKTATGIAIPTWRLDAASIETIDTSAVETAANQAVATNGAAVLQAALVVAAVTIQNTPSAKAAMFNVTEMLGMSQATFDAIETAILAAPGSFKPTDLLDTSSCTSTLCDAMKKAVGEVATGFTMTIEDPTGGTGGSSSAASDIMIGSSVLIALMSLVF